MKKGELRKDAIIKTAEKLFFEKGYDETSVQDILDAMSLSKGGFYHYFDTKLALMEEIAKQRVQKGIEQLRIQVRSGRYDSVQKINQLLSFVNIFNRETADFIAVTLKISYVDDDVNFRDCTRAYMLEQLIPLIDGVVFDGVRDGSFFSRYPGRIGSIVLMLSYDINDAVGRLLTQRAEDADCVIEIMDMLNAYRDSVENLLGASFGKIELFDLEHLMGVFRQTAEQIEQMKGKTGK